MILENYSKNNIELGSNELILRKSGKKGKFLRIRKRDFTLLGYIRIKLALRNLILTKQ